MTSSRPIQEWTCVRYVPSVMKNQGVCLQLSNNLLYIPSGCLKYKWSKITIAIESTWYKANANRIPSLQNYISMYSRTFVLTNCLGHRNLCLYLLEYTAQARGCVMILIHEQNGPIVN